MRAVILLFCALALSNCVTLIAIPPAIQYVSVVATVVSYVATGKGTSDHVISAVVDQDCALHRALLEDEICTENPVADEVTEGEVRALLAE